MTSNQTEVLAELPHVFSLFALFTCDKWRGSFLVAGTSHHGMSLRPAGLHLTPTGWVLPTFLPICCLFLLLHCIIYIIIITVITSLTAT